MDMLPTRAIGYGRVSTERQGDSGAGMEAQTAAIERECEHRGWELVRIVADTASGKTTRLRPHLAAALDALTNCEADVLMVAKLDRLSRSVADFAALMERARKEQWGVVALDIGIDTSTTNGELIASIIMALAQWERRMIGVRTRDALAAVKARGTTLGRPVTISGDAEGTIRLLRDAGHSYGDIARTLAENDVPTPQGGVRWYPSSVRAVYKRLAS